MILAYHKVDAVRRTHWWVSADRFHAQLAGLADKKVVYLDDYDPRDPRQAVISFDGVYADLVPFALPILKRFGYPFELFVVGGSVGAENKFDQPKEPPAWFASIAELEALVAGGGRLQWHSRSHGKLHLMSDAELDRELTVNEELKRAFPGQEHFRWFAYPHGQSTPALKAKIAARFTGALACDDGDPADRWFIPRTLAFEKTETTKTKVSVIIPNYNYGHFLEEAVASVLAQSVPPDEILVIDDASTDDSALIMAALEKRHGGKLRMIRNEANLGIVANFRKAVEATQGDYLAFLGADNRMRRDYVERCKIALDRDPAAGVAYTDMMVFGPLASVLAAKIPSVRTAVDGVYRWPMPEPTPEAIANLDKQNFIHGSSMYRRAAYEAVGGYSQGERAEDHRLFLRMVRAGWKPVHVAEPVIEYRQHSRDQANTALNTQHQARFFRKAYEEQRLANDEIRRELARAKWRLAQVQGIFQTKTRLQLARTLAVNLVAPHRKKVLTFLVDAAKAKISRKTTPPLPEALLTDDKLK
jgi:glycosyltransferase involved in cell wall biosynthesis